MSRSLHSSSGYLAGSNRWSRNDSDMEPEKSSIGEISSKISSRPEVEGTSSRPAARACPTRSCQRWLPSSQSKLSVWSARRSGTSSGSRILANEMRPVLLVVLFGWDLEWDSVREAAKRGPSTGLRTCQAHTEHPSTGSARWNWSAVGGHGEGRRQRKALA